MRKSAVYFKKDKAGELLEDENGYTFSYCPEYLALQNAAPVSMTLPLSVQKYNSNVLFPFFDGLIPEGWLLDISVQNWKLTSNDRMALLLACCKDCIGAVSIEEITEEPGNE